MLSEYVGRILRWVDSFAVQLIRWYFSHISQQQLRVVGVEDPTAVLAPPPAVATAPLPPAFEPVLLPSEGNKTEGIGNGDNPTEASSTSQDRGLERHPTFSLRTSNRSSRRGSEKDIFAADFKIDCEDVDVIVFGSINMDIKARAKGEWPVNDSSDFGELSHTAGGKGMNEAVAIARLEVKTAMIGRVGNDEHGAFLKSELARNHVDASNVRGGGKAAADETLGLRWREVKLEEGFSESKKAMEVQHDELCCALLDKEREREDKSDETIALTQASFRWLPMASDGFRWLPMALLMTGFDGVGSAGVCWLPLASDGFRWFLMRLTRRSPLPAGRVRRLRPRGQAENGLLRARGSWLGDARAALSLLRAHR